MISIMHTVEELMKTDGGNTRYKIGHVEFEIVEHNEIIIAVIPGTNGLKDWFDNTRFRKIKTNINDTKYKVHEGFLDQTNKIFDKIEHCDVFIGHSLGGAIAQICALKTSRPVITLGCPRVGNSKFAKAIKPLHTRVKSRGDSITHLPPWWFLYKHGGELIKVGKMDRPWWKFWALEDHMIQDYYDAIREKYWS